MRKDKESAEAALNIHTLKSKGERISRDAVLEATSQMIKLVGNLDTRGKKAAALEHHALHMGVGTQFMETIVPMADRMTQDLIDLHERKGAEISDSEARILTGFWLAKVFIEIQKGIKKHESEA